MINAGSDHGRFRPLLVPLTVLWVSLVGCLTDTTAVVVTVEALEGVGEPADLRVSFIHQNDFRETVLRPNDGQVFAPGTRTATFVIRAEGRDGPAEVTVVARDAAEQTLGKGSASVVIIEAAQVPVTIRLHPSDFQVNSQGKNNQFFSTASTGRQVAADAKGNFAVVWEDSCPTGQCRIFARLFDYLGNPRIKEDTGTTEDFVATDSVDNYDMPAVAMQPAGSFVTVWKRYSTAPTDKGSVYSRAFADTGRPEPQNPTEQQLSAATGVEGVTSPDVAALAGPVPSYVVVWSQALAGDTLQVMGRQLDAAGQPVEAAAFLVASFSARSPSDNLSCETDLHCPPGEHCTKSKCEPIPVEPAVAQGPDGAPGSFMVVWKQNGALNGRAYAADAKPASNAFDIALTPTGRAGLADIAPLPYGYAVIWADVLDTGADRDATSIRLRRFDITGKALEDEYTFNTTVAGAQRQPSIAMRPDGNLLAAWTSEPSTSEDPLGGVRGRLLLSNGLPLGRDFQLNTTTADVQLSPSVAAKASQSGGAAGFVIAFEDASAAGPDVEGSGIRARFYYPGTYDARDQQVGALCDQGNGCGASLYCASTHVGKRCVATCQGPGAACSDGGTCVQPSEAANQYICTYRTSP